MEILRTNILRLILAKIGSVQHWKYESGADPGAGKGRGTQVVGGWGEPDSLVQCYIFKAANYHLLVVSHCCFCHFWSFQMVVKSLNTV